MPYILRELVDGKFRQLEGLMHAAQSGRYIEGRDNVGMYALPGSRQEPCLVDVYGLHGFGDIFDMVGERMIERQERTKDSVLIRGPLNEDMIISLWLGVRHFLENATGFHPAEGNEKWEQMIKATVPGASHNEEQTVLVSNGEHYMAGFNGPLRDNKYYEVHADSHPCIVLPGILDHMNDFSFSTYDIVAGERRSQKESNFDVHLNGPANHVVISDLLELGAAIKEYCLEQCG